MEPLISLMLRQTSRLYHPGDELTGEYQIDAVDPQEVVAVEISVLWYTEGKGDEDLAVHYFQRRVPADAEEGDLRRLHQFSTVLPNSPLSYAGQIVKIHWCARVRVFFRGGKDLFFEQPFLIAARATQAVLAT